MTESDKAKLCVEIFGQNYTLRVSPEEEEKVTKIAEYVDNMMHKTGDDQPRLDYRDVAVLSAMNIAEEYFKLQQEYRELLNIIDEEK